jgi:hypothetical protein
MSTHSIMGMPRATAVGPAVTAPSAQPVPALLTKRRSVDFCLVATALCPWPRQG